jgi:hypothetical protein
LVGDFDSGCDNTFGAAMLTSGSAAPALSRTRRVISPRLLCAMASLPGGNFDAAFGGRFFKTIAGIAPLLARFAKAAAPLFGSAA